MKYHHHLLLWITMLLCLANNLLGQGATLSGRIVDASGAPLGLATIADEMAQFGTTADLNGDFTLENIPAGTHTIEVQLLGYLTARETITFEARQAVSKDFILNTDHLNLEAVVVSGTRYARDRKNNPIVVNVLDNKILEATQSIALSEGLNFQPGVRVETNCQNCGFTQVRLNGLQGAYAQILINSRPVFSALNSVYGLDQIPASMVDRVEVVRSGGSALYGSNAIGGTINIITQTPTQNSWELRSNTALLDGDALDQSFHLNGSIVNDDMTSGVTFYGMTRHRDSYDANDDGFTELVQLKNTVFGANAFFHLGKRSKLNLDFSVLEEYRRGGDRLDLAPHFTDITEELDHTTLFGGASFEHWTKDDRGKLSVYASVQRTDRDSYYGGLGGGRTSADSMLALSAYGLTEDLALVGGAQFTRYFSNKDVLTLGAEHQYYDTRDDIQGYRRLIDQDVHGTGFFAQYEWKPTPRLTALLGGRYDISLVNGDYRVADIARQVEVDLGVFSPRATLLYQINSDLRFRGGYARGFRAPQAFNEDLHISSVGGEPLFVILSDDLDKETSDAYTASFNYTKQIGLAQVSWLIEGFYTELHNPFTQVSTGATLPNGSIIEEVRNGEGATVSGINLEAGYSPSNQFSIQLGGTLQQTRYDEMQLLFEGEGDQPDVMVDEFVRTPDVYGYFTSFYQVTPAFKIDLSGTYTGGMVVPRVVDDSGFLDLFDSDPFFDANIKASYQFDLSGSVFMEVSSGLRNVFNSYQPEFERGPTRDSDFVYGPMVPRSVFLSVKIGNM